MSAALKIIKQDPSELELQVAQAFVDLENSSPDFKTELKLFQFKSARELEVSAGKKALVIFVPVPALPAVHKIQQRLTRELEKKFSDRHVVFLAERRILPRAGRKALPSQPRPMSRTLTKVHEALLEDLVFPTEIIGKRTKYQVGGTRIQKVFLDSKDSTFIDNKLESFQSVYNKLTGKKVVFEIPANQGEVY